MHGCISIGHLVTSEFTNSADTANRRSRFIGQVNNLMATQLLCPQLRT